MILTCPECATSYFVDDSRIPAGGRTVKCSLCGARWRARGEPTIIEPPPEQPAPAPAAAPEPPPAVEALAAGIAPDELDFAAAEPAPEPAPHVEPAPEPLRILRAPPHPSARARARREAKARVLVWGAAAALVVAVVGAAILFRGAVVRLWPKSQAAYAGLGLPVNTVGLVIEGVRAEPGFQAGRPVLTVTGAIRNVKGEAVAVPPLRINLLDRAGQPITARVVRPTDPRVPAGATRHFAIAISDPPSNAHDLEVLFETGQQRAAAAPAAVPAASPPAEARPLPPEAPDALPEHG